MPLKPMSQQLSDILEVIRACIAGDAESQHRFQEEYGEDIYNFPVKVCGLPLEKAADFYVYVFDKDRLFSRLKTFAGRNNIQFRTFLSYYVLRFLLFEWLRTEREINTTYLEDAQDDDMAEAVERETQEDHLTAQFLASLDPEERLDFKLLHLIEYDLEPEDLSLLVKTSGRSLVDTLTLITQVQEGLRRKDEWASRLRDKLDAVWGWILLQRQEVQDIDEKIRLFIAERNSVIGPQQLLRQKEKLERNLARRFRQRERIMEEIHRLKLTTPYKDIARLLNTTVGTAGSRISRLRARLAEKLQERQARKEQAA